MPAIDATPGTSSSPSRWKHCSPELHLWSLLQLPSPVAHLEEDVHPEPPLFTATAVGALVVGALVGDLVVGALVLVRLRRCT